MSNSNRAACLTRPDGSPIEALSAPMPKLGPNEVVIRAYAVAINPVDAVKQVMERRQGVRHRSGLDKRGKGSPESAFQELVLTRDFLTAKLPDNVSSADAAVLPLGASTAACGLFQEDQLALESVPVGKKKTHMGKTVLVWGASTSVGNNAVQLAVAAGYDVIATASPKNWDVVRWLGAVDVFDYNSPKAVRKIVAAFEGRKCAGAIAIGQGSQAKCIDIVAQIPGATQFVSQVSIDTPGPFPKTALSRLPYVAKFLWTRLALQLKAWRSGVKCKFVFGSDIVEWDAEEGMVFRFLEDALQKAQYVTAPEPMVIGNGLDKIQQGLDTIMGGVSGKKVVVTLD
ncbi:hypothetical protein EDB81DRAFT_903771 [Dactylonectria macrodidyma]|uniref:Enoyl reductase (ER) domain-containing protein n=1 Tax=Dactylonectria macrodidyma TaxID=307937 RepID=A0A9P9EAK9_9HYPO|nr:hypothetical protein EDB81DRAFT_903771 [Dactylonectria macrodidyma]